MYWAAKLDFPSVVTDPQTFDRLLVMTVQTMLRVARERERGKQEVLSSLIATQTAFVVAALRGKWRNVEHFDPLAAGRRSRSVRVSAATARAFFAAAAADQLPEWVVTLAPVQEMRLLLTTH